MIFYMLPGRQIDDPGVKNLREKVEKTQRKSFRKITIVLDHKTSL